MVCQFNSNKAQALLYHSAEYCNEELEEVMEFRLIYEGELFSRTSRNLLDNKNKIRLALHAQLAEIWEQNPVLRRIKTHKMTEHDFNHKVVIVAHREAGLRPVPDPGETELDAIGRRYERGGIRFVPLVNEVFGLVCGLNILFLRREKPGALITQGGDIDNRIKTVLDALRVPRNADEMRNFPNVVSPFFCLMADDALVTEMNVTTDTFLKSLGTNHPDSEAHLVIHVTVKASVDRVEGLRGIL